jgi:hypothetical protein
MHTHITKNTVIQPVQQQKSTENESVAQFIDHRPEAAAQRKIQETIANSQRTQEPGAYPQPVSQLVQPIQKKANKTGLPDHLKSGIEHLSGYALDDVKVHYNSEKPADLQAHAFAQGSDIHIAPGQEKHLPHEAWHVVQQKQGRVKANKQLKGKVPVNDEKELEKEADVMGAKAVQMRFTDEGLTQLSENSAGSGIVQKKDLSGDKLNVVGENHLISNERRVEEQTICTALAGGQYWTEEQFNVPVNGGQTSADPHSLRLIHVFHTIAGQSKMLAEKDSTAEPGQVTNLAHLTNLATGPMIALAATHWGETEGVAYPGPLNHAQQQIRDNNLRNRFNHLLAFQVALAALAPLHGLPLNPQNRALIIQHHTALTAARTAMVANLLQKDYADKGRSRVMHEAAQTHQDTKGVWKIGQSHVDDIVKDIQESDPPQYNLVTEDEFEEIGKNYGG